jgi:hypothetical protein
MITDHEHRDTHYCLPYMQPPAQTLHGLTTTTAVQLSTLVGRAVHAYYSAQQVPLHMNIKIEDVSKMSRKRQAPLHRQKVERVMICLWHPYFFFLAHWYRLTISHTAQSPKRSISNAHDEITVW